MPPDRGSAKRTSNAGENKKGSKVTSTKKDVKAAEEAPRRVKSTVKENGKEETTSSRKELGKGPKNPLQKSVTNQRLTSKKRADVEEPVTKIRDVSKNSSKRKDSPSKSLATKTSSQAPSKMKSESSVYDRLAGKTHTSTTKRAASMQRSSSIQRYQSPEKSLKKAQNRTSDSTSKTKTEKSASESSKNSQVKKGSKTEDETPRLGHQRTKTRTLDPHEIKFAKGLPEHPAELSSAVKKELPYEKKAESRSLEPGNSKETAEEDDYEDDFEDYESDFEEDIPDSSDASSVSEARSVSDSSLDESAAPDCEMVVLSSRPAVEEEKKLDSGNYDLSESGKQRISREMEQIKAAMEKENAIYETEYKSVSDLSETSLVSKDEGYDDERVERAGFINFESAHQRVQQRVKTARVQRKGQRGRELLSMITLDSVPFSLLDIPPVPYDVYMKTYGRANSVQVHVQTNEDCISEEVQCEAIVMKSKWTQHPVAFHTVKDNPEATAAMFAVDRLGCGGDGPVDRAAVRKEEKFDLSRLSKFLLQRGQFILQVLEQDSAEIEKSTWHAKGTPVSSGYISFATDSVSFIKGRPVSSICFTQHPPSLLATVHNRNINEDKHPNTSAERAVICIWNVSRPVRPERILASSEDVTACSFDATGGLFLFGGLSDGSISLWDLRESLADHCILDSVVDKWVLFSPTYSSAEILKSDGHLERVVAVQAVSPAASLRDLPRSEVLAPQQVCSLDSEGVVIVWTVIPNVPWKAGEEDLGLAHWGHVRLVPSIRINTTDCLCLDGQMRTCVECHDLQIDLEDPRHLYVCTNTGHIIHCLINGGKPQPRVYSCPRDKLVPATCIESCPFDQPNFLVGCEGGSIRLYTRGSSRSLISFTGSGHTVRCLQWSVARPTVFYVLDTRSRIHVWDVSVSDIRPVEMLNFESNILCMKLSQKSAEKQQYLAIATAEGEIHLHKMKPEYSQSSSTIFDAQLKLFLKYTSCL